MKNTKLKIETLAMPGLVLVAGRWSDDRTRYSVRALDPGTGAMRWDYVENIGDTRLNGTAVVLDDSRDRLYTVIGESVAALQLSTGLQIWRSEELRFRLLLHLARAHTGRHFDSGAAVRHGFKRVFKVGH